MSTATPAKAKKAAKPKKPAAHPTYKDMIVKAITVLKDRKGSSRQAIQKYIIQNFKVDANKVAQHLKVALRNGVRTGTLKQMKGTGAAGSFKLPENAAKPKKKKAVKAKKPKKAAAKKPAGEKKAAKPKKSPAKKAKKPKSPKKAKAPAKKAAKPKVKKPKSPKKAKKPAAKKSPKKAAAKKK